MSGAYKMRSGDGERRALRGYGAQYRAAASIIHEGLLDGSLRWVGLADRRAGSADDLVAGLTDRVVAYQFKHSDAPTPFSLRTVLIGHKGTGGLIDSLVEAWRSLQLDGHAQLEIHYVTSHVPSTAERDRVGDGASAHTRAFLREHETARERTLAEWCATRWAGFVTELHARTGLEAAQFERFLGGFHVCWGHKFFERTGQNPRREREVALIRDRLLELVSNRGERERWTRAELLEELGWDDRTHAHHVHHFPVGAYVQSNAVTEAELRCAIESNPSGYLSLVGPPGSGKSTLLQTAIEAAPGLAVARYLAFVPGSAHGLGRGEAAAFLDDAASGLIDTGLAAVTLRAESLPERRRRFAELIVRAGARWQADAVRTVLVIDGLDHVPREERPSDSMLAALPLPAALPEGVLIVLGTQQVELDDMPPAVTEQAAEPARQIVMAPLSVDAIGMMARRLAPEATLPQERLYELSCGHPLVARYLIERLRAVGDTEHERLLGGEFVFDGDLDRLYRTAWRGLESDEAARKVLSYIAHAEAPLAPALLATVLSDHAAIERALKIASHLLERGSRGWTVFHNSFRLFVCRQIPTRFGDPDPEFATALYRDLARLARSAPSDSAQRFLELRYRARAGEGAAVLDLAHPALLRAQLAAGRLSSDVLADIRLAYACVPAHGDTAALFRLMLGADEMACRGHTLGTTPTLATLAIGLGELDAADSLVSEGANAGFELVVALLHAGERTRARALFERLHGRLTADADPLRSSDSDVGSWLGTVFLFRDASQIRRTISGLVRRSATAYGGRNAADADVHDYAMRRRVAISIVRHDPQGDAEVTAAAFELTDVDTLDLELLATIEAVPAGRPGCEGIRRALASPAFSGTSPVRRRHAALVAAHEGDLVLASAVFDTLPTPDCVSLAEDLFGPEQEAVRVLEAVILHARLEAWLGRSPIDPERPAEAHLSVLQGHAFTLGALRGRVAGANVAPAAGSGEVVRVVRALLRYLDTALRRTTDHFGERRQITALAPTLVDHAVRAAAAVGTEELERVARLLQPPEDDSRRHFPGALWRKAATALHDAGAGCSHRCLEYLLDGAPASTPTEHVEALAAIGLAFARNADMPRARELFCQAMSETLGHAQPAKKDPQYSYWTQLLERANAADPAGREARVAALLRMVNGMSQTEGYSSNDRMATALVLESGIRGPALGWAAARALIDVNALGWAGALDALLIGSVRRQPELAPVVATTWCALILPHYREPYFQTERTGVFIGEIVAALSPARLEAVAASVQEAIETLSQRAHRVALLRKLAVALEDRGAPVPRQLVDATERWASDVRLDELGPAASSSIPTITSLEELDQTLQADSESDSGPSGAGYQFRRIVRDSAFDTARSLFERWPDIQRDPLNHVALVDRAVAAGRTAEARSLFAAYPDGPGFGSSWSPWEEVPQLHHLRQRAELDFPQARSVANEEVCRALASGRAYAGGLLEYVGALFGTLERDPPWPVLWETLAERLIHTREHDLGRPFEIPPASSMDEAGLLAGLYVWAFDVGTFELRHFARLALSRLVDDASATQVLVRVFEHLLKADGEKPLEALSLLCDVDPGNPVASELLRLIEPLVEHPDYALATLAYHMCVRQSRGVVEPRPVTVPLFYTLAVPDDDPLPSASSPDTQASQRIGLGEDDAAGWAGRASPLFGLLAGRLASPAHVHHRVRQLIDAWGGSTALGVDANERRRRELTALCRATNKVGLARQTRWD